ncbi:MAG TPA: GntG family PLP-dependent aldolase [Acidimicrobiia bacterium]|nr:GntG family PLP-dependent aldolase [Acidimicrobiia bacterium]
MPAPDGTVDLRSDTVTRPTPGMRRAMAEAEVGDDVYGEDPTVLRLETLAAERVGKEAALFVPSGTMGNQIALRLFGVRGSEVLCGRRAHVMRFEAAGAAANAGVQLHGLPDHAGCFRGADVEAALEASHYHRPAVSLVCIENTSQAAGGRPWRAAEVAEVGEVAERHGLPLHCDGARIFNAAVALGVQASTLTEPCTTVMFCVSKGLGAPVGSLLCGPSDVVLAGREERHRLGGAMRQAGVIAAAGIVALETGVERLADDHRRAQRLASVLAELWLGSIDPATVETNMVCASTAALPEKLVPRLAERGILAGFLDPATTRFVTHRDVDDDDLERAVTALAGIAAEGG